MYCFHNISLFIPFFEGTFIIYYILSQNDENNVSYWSHRTLKYADFSPGETLFEQFVNFFHQVIKKKKKPNNK